MPDRIISGLTKFLYHRGGQEGEHDFVMPCQGITGAFVHGGLFRTFAVGL